MLPSCRAGAAGAQAFRDLASKSSTDWAWRGVWGVMPNVRAKRATTAGHQARAGENVPRTTGPGLVACRWRSA